MHLSLIDKSINHIFMFFGSEKNMFFIAVKVLFILLQVASSGINGGKRKYNLCQLLVQGMFTSVSLIFRQIYRVIQNI